MVRKRVRDADTAPEVSMTGVDNGEDSGSEDDVDMINVEFEWFNMAPEVDFHGLKSLLRQLLDVDSQLFDLSALADLILSQPTIGSTVKVDGKETDPYAFLTILNMHEHKEHPAIKALTEYLIEKSKSGTGLEALGNVLSSPSNQVGLILTERLINAAIEDKEPYEFTHYLIVSKTYLEVQSTLDQEDAPRQKKKKQVGKETFYFHPEDEVLQRHAAAHGGWNYTKDEGDSKADSKRAFQELGIRPQGHAILIEAAKFDGAVKAVGEYIGLQQ
ncbi:Mss4p nuclear export [Pseudogymnoascus australis]